jgi:aldose sugar dehydrogenase
VRGPVGHAGNHLDAAEVAGRVVEQERFLTELKQRYRDLLVAPDGTIYVLTDETAGALLRIEPEG